MKKCIYIAMGTALLLTAAAKAEMRVWTDKNGNSIEAEFIQTAGSKIVLETEEGRRLMVPANGLCDEDRKYLAETIPPTLKIDVDVDLDRDKQGNGHYYERTTETVSCDVTIQKTNKDQCTRKFKAHIYLLAKHKGGNRRKIVEVQERSISFANKNSATLDASTTIESEEGYYWEDGYRYEGYLVCVVDDDDNVVAVKTNRNSYETHLQKLMGGRKGTVFAKNFTKTKR